MLKTFVGLLGLFACASAQSNSLKVKWLEGAPEHLYGVTFGLPWPRGQHLANATTFSVSGDAQLQSWVNAYWPDGSLKWTGHALAGSSSVADEYTITASGPGNSTASKHKRQATGIQVSENGDEVGIDTGKLVASFPKSGNILVSSIRTGGKTVGTNGRLVLKSQTGISDVDDSASFDIQHFSFTSKIANVTVSKDNTARAVVTVQGNHQIDGEGGHDDWLPFTVRFYLYSNSEAIRIVHTIVYDGDYKKDFISGIGVRFDVPLAGEEQYNRHVRIAGVDGGILHESVRGITGLRRDPGAQVRQAQFNGTTTSDKSTWDQRVTTRLHWIPTWSDYRLTQLSPDGFSLKKRTKAGQSWVTIPGGTRAGGLAYIGGSTVGGLAVALRDFWKKYPTSLDISNGASDEASITLWLYSPQAEPMDVRPYHDGLGQDTYAKQLDALEITYEDWEGGYDTPYGVARTNELFVYAFASTPSADTLSALTNHTNNPPVLIPEPEVIRESQALGTYWSTPKPSDSADTKKFDSHMDFLIKFYVEQVEQRKWYGFWDHGDIIHSYDADRHTWRYDIGGYAWDNSELAPDLFFWYHFLRTGRADSYRLAEAQVRHGADVDSYHLGNFTGLGTRHGIQHWSDSSKQLRISTPVYRKTFFYLSGGDERTHDVIREVLQAEKALLVVDTGRKVRAPDVVYIPDPEALYINFGTSWSGLAAAFLIEWETRGPRWEEARDKLIETMKTYPKLKNGFVTGDALYNSFTGAWSPPPVDPSNNGSISVSHLSGVFGVLETLDQLFDHYGSDTPKDFIDAFVDYCYYYGASRAEQAARYGKDFGSLNLKQGHSRFTAYAANKRNNSTLAARAWKEFLTATDGISPGVSWTTQRIDGSDVLAPVDEAAYVSTNAAALYGVAAIENLALIGPPDGSTVIGNGTAKIRRGA